MYPIFFRLPSWLPLMGGEPITSFGVFMFLSFRTGGILLRSEMERTGHDPDRAWDLVFMGVLGGVIGAQFGPLILQHISDQNFKVIFGAFLIGTGAWLIYQSRTVA